METPQGRVEEVRGGDVRGAATPTVTQGVSGELSWVSKPITGHVYGLNHTSRPLIHWSDDWNFSSADDWGRGQANKFHLRC